MTNKELIESGKGSVNQMSSDQLELQEFINKNPAFSGHLQHIATSLGRQLDSLDQVFEAQEQTYGLPLIKETTVITLQKMA